MYANNPHSSRFSAGLGANEERTEPYINTAKEHHSWQRRPAQRAAEWLAALPASMPMRRGGVNEE